MQVRQSLKVLIKLFILFYSVELCVSCPLLSVSQALIINGTNGHKLWTADFVCPRLVLETSAISTSTGQSVFLFWASEPIRAQKNVTKTTVSLP